jgi:hypothetical protein
LHERLKLSAAVAPEDARRACGERPSNMLV